MRPVPTPRPTSAAPGMGFRTAAWFGVTAADDKLFRFGVDD